MSRMETRILTADESGIRLDAFLASRLAVSRSLAASLIDDGNVTLNGTVPKKKTAVNVGDILEVAMPDLKPAEAIPQDIPLDIVYEDGELLVVNKPKGMVVHPAPGNYDGTLVNALLYHCGDSLSGINGVLRPGIVHERSAHSRKNRCGAQISGGAD